MIRSEDFRSENGVVKRPLAGPIGLVLVSMLSVQLGASLAKGLFPAFGPGGTSLSRLCAAALVLLPVARPWRHRLARRDMLAVAAYGGALGGMNFLFYLAVARIPLGVAVATEFIGPLTLAVLASRRRSDFVWVALAALGIALILPLTSATRAVDLLGLVFALGAGIFWALYILAGKKLGERIPEATATALGMLFAAVVVLPFGLAGAGGRLWNPGLWPTTLAVGILSSALPYTLEMFALKKIPTRTFGILMSLEPAIGALSGLAFLHEILTPRQWLAIGLVIVASAGASLTTRVTPGAS